MKLNKKTNKLYARMKAAEAALTEAGKRDKALMMAYRWGVWFRARKA